MSADLTAAMEHTLEDRLLATSWTINDDAVMWHLEQIRAMDVLDAIEEWQREARRGPGGRPRTFPNEAVLDAALLCATNGLPLCEKVFHEVLFRKISDRMRRELRLPEPPPPLDRRGRLATYRNVRTRFHGLLDVMDPSPYPRNRLYTPEEFEARKRFMTPETQATMYARLGWVANQIIERSIQLVPRALWSRWTGSVSVDATPVPAFARPWRKPKGKPVERHSSDPDAGWYQRTEDEMGQPERKPEDSRGRRIKKKMWAYEATFVIAGAEHEELLGTFPQLVVGMAPLHKPSEAPGEQAIRALQSIRERGHPANLLVGDRAYSNSVAEKYQLPARNLGYEHCFDYRIDQLGVQDSYAGALQIEGNFYCPAIPKTLIDATKDRRNGLIDAETYAARIRARASFLLRPKSLPDDDGYVRMMCPAAGTSPTARCDLKPASITESTAGRTRIPLHDSLLTHPAQICKQQSVTFPPTAGAKFAQALQYQGDLWLFTYPSLRNTIEGFNGIVKDGAHEALADPKRRRVRGVAAQTLSTALLTFSANHRKLESFANVCVVDGDGVARRPRSPRKNSLRNYGPPQ